MRAVRGRPGCPCRIASLLLSARRAMSGLNLTTFVARVADGMLLVATMDSGGPEAEGKQSSGANTPKHDDSIHDCPISRTVLALP